MSTTTAKQAVERLAAKRRELDAEAFAEYAFIALGVVAYNDPRVFTFALDEVDAHVVAVSA